MNDPREPFERCGYTIHRGGSPALDYCDMVRISKDGWAVYLRIEDYEQFDDDDTAFKAVIDARRTGPPDFF